MPQSENRDDVPTAWTADSCNRIRVRMRHLIADHYQMRRVFQYVIHRCMRLHAVRLSVIGMQSIRYYDALL